MSTAFQSPRPRIVTEPAAYAKGGERLRLLLIHDEQPVPEVLDATLRSAGYDLFPVWTGKEALQTVQFVRPDLILLELGSPNLNGKHVLHHLREFTNIPIIVITLLHEEGEQITCLDAGADDYIAKPFTMGELLARLRAALRRAFGIPRGEVFKTGGLKIDFSRRAVSVWDEPVRLTATEYALLQALAGHAGIVKTHYQLIHEVWGTIQYQDAAHLLRVTVSNLRRKLLCDSGRLPLIVTEAGIGYRLRRDPEWSRELRRETPLRKSARVARLGPNHGDAARMKSGTCSSL